MEKDDTPEGGENFDRFNPGLDTNQGLLSMEFEVETSQEICKEVPQNYTSEDRRQSLLLTNTKAMLS
jgi:hypothetical protein